MALRQDMDHMFDEFSRGSLPAPFDKEWTAFDPRVDVVETDQEVKVTAELPGLDAQDVDLTLSHNVLTIKGEKKHEHEEQGENYYRAERSYGSFQRSITLPQNVETDRVEAAFDKGVLTVTLPKTAADETLKIAVKSQ